MPGYNVNFLDGITLPMPSFSPGLAGLVVKQSELRNEFYADYINYTVVTSKEKCSPIFVALNIDQNLLQKTRRSDKWQIDTRIGAQFQINNDYYRNNPWDRGHLARRANASWGKDLRKAQRASDETFYYSNACLQHANFNQDEWLALEDWVLNLSLDKDGKISSFSGPIYGDYVRTITPEGREPAMIPSAFFKVVCFINKNTNELDVRAFIMLQDRDALADKSGRNMFDFQVYQVTVSEIEEKTGLEFEDDVYQKNPLFFNENENARSRLNISHFPERIEIDGPEEIIDADTPRTFFSDDDIDVYIAAAMVNPTGIERDSEWISIINLTKDIVDLNDWTLSDTKRTPLKLSNVLYEKSRTLIPGQAAVIKPISPLRLSNEGGSILLLNKENQRVDRVKYTKEDVRKQGIPVIFAYRMN